MPKIEAILKEFEVEFKIILRVNASSAAAAADVAREVPVDVDIDKVGGRKIVSAIVIDDIREDSIREVTK